MQNDFEYLLEETPIRGDIDWQRTITRTIHESPDQPPQRFDTRVLQQSTATPENLLVVAILHIFHQTVQEVLQADSQQEILDDQERLVLLEMEERAENALNKPYTRELREEASSVDIDALVEQVTPRLKPGANPYRNLIAWWENFRDLHIGKTLAQRHLTLANKRADEQSESWLYELWIALEILDLLHVNHLIIPETLKVENDHLQCLFTWDERRFRFQYQRHGTPEMNETPGWQGTNATISTYVIEREQPSKITT